MCVVYTHTLTCRMVVHLVSCVLSIHSSNVVPPVLHTCFYICCLLASWSAQAADTIHDNIHACTHVPCVQHYLYVPPGTTPSRHMNVHRHNPCLTFNNSQSTYVFHFFASSGLPSVSNLCLFLKCRFKLLLFANFMPHPACLQ